MSSSSKWKIASAFATATAMIVSLSACTGGGSPTNTAGSSSTGGGTSTGTLTVAVGANPNSLDPLHVLGQAENPVTMNIAQPLFALSAPNYQKILPLTAKSFQVSGDGLDVTIMLKTGITFQDGQPFDAAAVAWNLERLRDTPFFLQSVFAPMKSIKAVGKSEISIHMDHPDPLLQRGLAADQAAMVSPKSMTEYGNSATAYLHPVGTGPYVFKSYTPNSSFTMTVNRHYWGPKPAYAGITYQIVPEANVRESLIRAGQVDVIDNPPPADLDALSKSSDLTVSVNKNGSYNGLVYVNTQWKQLKDVRVRQALNYAVDRNAIVKSVLSGYGTPALKSFVPRVYTDYCQTGGYEYNPAKAKALLKAAGATNLSMVMYTPQGHYPGDLQTAEAVAQYLRAVGIKIDLQQFSWPTYLAKSDVKLADTTAPLQFVGLGSLVTDAGNYYGYFTSAQLPPDGLNNSYLQDPKVDKLVAAQAVEADPAKRQQLNCELGTYMTEQAPAIILYQWDYSLVARKGVENVIALPDGQVSPSTYRGSAQ